MRQKSASIFDKDGNDVLLSDLTPTVIDDSPYIDFLLKVKTKSDYSIDLDAYEVTSWSQDKTPFEMELCLSGSIKWDGCSHVYFGKENDDGSVTGYLHLCGEYDWKKHIKFMAAIYEFAAKNIKNL